MVKTVLLPSFRGITLLGANEQVVPEKFAGGRLIRSQASVTFEACSSPAVRVATMVVVPEFPGVSLIPAGVKRV